MANDSIKTYYEMGYRDAKDGRKRRRPVPYNFKLSYLCGWSDARASKPNRYEVNK